MKKLYPLLFMTSLFLFSSCEEDCDCEYVVYDSDPTNNYTWTESYRSTWDTTCEDEVLDESTSTIMGEPWYSRTEIECK